MYPERDKGVVAGGSFFQNPGGGTMSVTEEENERRTDGRISLCLILDVVAFRDDGSVGGANPGVWSETLVLSSDSCQYQ